MGNEIEIRARDIGLVAQGLPSKHMVMSSITDTKIKKELRCFMYIYQLLMINTIMYTTNIY